MINFNEYINKLYPEKTFISCRTITFQVTDDCCLKCSYCYQTHKGHKMMNQTTAKEAVDLLFKMYNDNEPNAYINKATHGIILEFIGGEPLMNIEIIDYVLNYFIDTCIRLNHEWLIILE